MVRFDGPDGWMVGHGGYMLVGGLITLLFWAALIAFGVWAVKRFTERPRPSGPSEAMKILQERFARGEIDGEEFDRRKRLLEGG